MGKAKFITIEGIDGAGKTTQVKLLADYLRSCGKTVATFRDPGDTELGGKLREILLHSIGFDIGLRAETLLYMAARAQLVVEKIRPAMDAVDFVISDRYMLSNMAYQGAGGGLGMYVVRDIGRFATHDLEADVTLLLDIDPQVALGRLSAGADRIEQRGLAYFTAVGMGFNRWVQECQRQGRHTQYAVFAASTIEATHASIKTYIEQYVM